MKHFFLFILLVAASCSGQVKTDLTQEKKNQHSASEDSIPKIVRTLGVVSGNLKCELQDRNGNIWFSTGGEGIYRSFKIYYKIKTVTFGFVLGTAAVCGVMMEKRFEIIVRR